jgi:heterodisulfide reductase subunit B
MSDQAAAIPDRQAATDSDRFALYPGCLVLQRMPQYELATKRLLAALDVTLVDMHGAACCGAPVVESFSDEWVALSGYNLALAQRLGLDVLTLCGSCTNTLRRARRTLQDGETLEKVNRRLAPLSLQLGTGSQANDTTQASSLPQAFHLLQVLAERREALRARVSAPLSLRVALTYPCQVSRPADVAGFDDPLRPRAMHDLVALTGATIADTGVEWECCGSSCGMSDQALALAAGRRKLDGSREADVLVDGCGNCHLLLERMQRAIWPDRDRRLPVLFLPQLLGLALGLAPQDLGVNPTALER